MTGHEPDDVGTWRSIVHELKHHVPFTLVGTLTGAAIAAVFLYRGVDTQ
ncbi:hypothetical protein LCGC14_1965350, partial [marine sediment metagenome]